LTVSINSLSHLCIEVKAVVSRTIKLDCVVSIDNLSISFLYLKSNGSSNDYYVDCIVLFCLISVFVVKAVVSRTIKLDCIGHLSHFCIRGQSGSSKDY
jgi:hypothetical protein